MSGAFYSARSIIGRFPWPQSTAKNTKNELIHLGRAWVFGLGICVVGCVVAVSAQGGGVARGAAGVTLLGRLALVCAGPAAAQNTSGAIAGTITETQGGVLPDIW